MNVGVSLGFRRVYERFPNISCKFFRVSAGFPEGFRAFRAGFHGFCMGFVWSLKSFAGFVQFSICGRFSKVSAGFLGFPVALFGEFESWRKVITVITQRYAKSYIFVGSISGARKRWNFTTILRGASTVCFDRNLAIKTGQNKKIHQMYQAPQYHVLFLSVPQHTHFQILCCDIIEKIVSLIISLLEYYIFFIYIYFASNIVYLKYFSF